MNTENVAMTIMLVGVLVEAALIIFQAFELREWKRRAITAESECKVMNAIYGPHHKG
jgi:hypothetical protein